MPKDYLLKTRGERFAATPFADLKPTVAKLWQAKLPVGGRVIEVAAVSREKLLEEAARALVLACVHQLDEGEKDVEQALKIVKFHWESGRIVASNVFTILLMLGIPKLSIADDLREDAGQPIDWRYSDQRVGATLHANGVLDLEMVVQQDEFSFEGKKL